MNLMNGTEPLLGEKFMQVVSELQPILPSLSHLKVVSVRRFFSAMFPPPSSGLSLGTARGGGGGKGFDRV